jgi:hypothetical protein
VTPTNPYSSERHASPDVFRGYTEKQFEERLSVTWNLEEITRCLLRIAGVAPSFWIVGERKLGKTSFLLKLESMLYTQTARTTSHRGAVPLYVCCMSHPSLLSFYRGIFERAKTIAKNLSLEGFRVLSILEEEPVGADGLSELLAQDLASLVGQLTDANGRALRLVLLIDHIEVAFEQGWGTPLFLHLRSLLTRPPYLSCGHDLMPESLSAVVAGSRTLQEAPAFSSLTDVLEEVPLRPLTTSEVEALISISRSSPLESGWLRTVYQATAGHPWLVQFIMEQLSSSFQDSPTEHELRTIITTRFQREPTRSLICRYWLDRLPEEGIKVLAHLALDQHRDTAKDLVQRTGLTARTVTDHLQRMAELGIVYQPTLPRSDRYVLGEIFKDWFLEHTGGRVFLEEIAFLQRQAVDLEAQTANSGRTFTLFTTSDPDMLLADGLYGRKVQLQNLQDTANRLERESRKAEDKRDLDFIAEMFQERFQQRDWEEVWRDYARQMEKDGEIPKFVFRFTDDEFLEFPIEMMQFDGRFLGLAAPVYKELIGAGREPAYRLSHSPFPLGTPLNILLVASSFGGEFERRKYPPLPRAEDELVEIVSILASAATEGRVAINKIVVLTDGKTELPDHVERHPASAENFERALRGELNAQFHILHYSGHYIHNDRRKGGGLLFRGEGRDGLLGLSRLQNALSRSKLRLAFFNACRSGQYESQRANYHLGVAHTTLTSGVPAVIGMRWIIGDDEGFILSRIFYQEFMRSGIPEIALLEARRRVQAEEGEGSILWAAPVMLTR